MVWVVQGAADASVNNERPAKDLIMKRIKGNVLIGMSLPATLYNVDEPLFYDEREEETRMIDEFVLGDGLVVMLIMMKEEVGFKEMAGKLVPFVDEAKRYLSFTGVSSFLNASVDRVGNQQRRY